MTDEAQICRKEQTGFSKNPSKTYMRGTSLTEYRFFLPSSFPVYQILTFSPICTRVK